MSQHDSVSPNITQCLLPLIGPLVNNTCSLDTSGGFLANTSGGLDDVIADEVNKTLVNYSSTSILWKLARRRSRPDYFKQVLDFLNLYLTPVIILVGVVGNVMSFLVFTRTHLARLSSSVYLASLSIADTGFLLALAVVWLSRVGVPLFRQQGWCQGTVYFTYVFCFLSVWNVVSFTAERYIIVYHPLRKDAFCTRKKAKIVVGVFAFISLVMYTFALWTSGIITFDNQGVCTPLPRYYDVITVMTSIDTILSCIIPSVLIVILNVRIILKLHQYQLKRAELSRSVALPSGDVHLRRRSLIHASISITGSMHIKFSSPNKDHDPSTATQTIVYPDNCQRVVRSRSQFRTARMLLVLSSVFVLLNLPSHVFRVQVFVHNFVGGGTTSTRGKVHWQELFQLVYFLNFAINFFVYSAYGRQFRNSLKRMCRPLPCVRKRFPLVRMGSLEKQIKNNKPLISHRDTPHTIKNKVTLV